MIDPAADARHVLHRALRRGVANVDNERWSLNGAPWLQLVAISGKSDRRESRGNKRIPLRLAATGCLRRCMVRRGSTVRVRQRALKALQIAFYSLLFWRLGMERVSRQSKTASFAGAFGRDVRRKDFILRPQVARRSHAVRLIALPQVRRRFQVPTSRSSIRSGGSAGTGSGSSGASLGRSPCKAMTK